MKKIIAIAAATLVFAACNSKTEETPVETIDTTVAVDSVKATAVNVDSVIVSVDSTKK